MTEQRPRESEKLRRAYRTSFAASVCLAAIGAPLLMQGTVTLVRSLTAAPAASSPVHGFGLFLLSAMPMALAGLTWRRTRIFQDSLGEDL
jgi:hypothetical protein